MRSNAIVAIAGIVFTAIVAASAPDARAPSTALVPPSGATIALRGHPQTLHLYGSRGAGDPIVVSSGDGGWIHLAPEVAEVLAARGFFVVGFDTLAYLQGFTSGSTTLATRDEPADYRTLIDFAARGAVTKPILVGVSEGAGLSVLASTDPMTRQSIAGVIALGLPRLTELGWRWKDSLTYLTHRVPDEPTFRTTDVIGRVGSTPLAVIHSSGDEFTSVEEVRTILGAASQPKMLSIVQASNHRFSGNLPALQGRLLQAIDWIRQHETR
jgi:hypothetical protein